MTTLTIKLEDDLMDEVRRRASRVGAAEEQVAAQVVRDRFALERLLRPIRDAFERSGMTEDEAADLFESERQQMHDECRKDAASG